MSATLRLAAAALALALALGLLAAPAVAADPPAGQNVALPFPAKAPLVAQINGHERAKARLLKTLDALPPGESAQVKKHLGEGLQHLLEGRALTAVPGDARWFVVVHDLTTLGDDQPAVSVLVPVTSAADFKKTFLTADERKSIEKAGDGVESVKTSAAGDEATVYLAEVKGHVALSTNKETAESYAGKYTPAQSGSMGADLSASFLAADAALYVNMDVINDLYGDKIRQFKELIDFALGQAAQGGAIPGLGKKQMELIKTVLQGAIQGVEDGKGLVVAAEFRPDGANVRMQGRFADDSASAAMLKPEVPGPLADLAKLPKGLGTYGGSKFGPKFAGLWAQFSQEFAGPEDDENAAGRVEKQLAAVQAAGPGAVYTASSAPDRAITVTTYKAPEKAAAAVAKLYEGLPAGGRVSNVVLKDQPKVTFEAQNHRGFVFAEVRLAFDFDATVEALPENVRESSRDALKRLANEKTTLWLGTDGKVVAQLVGKDWATARKLLDEYLDGSAGVGAEGGFKLTRKNLPADATAVYLTETAQLLEMLAEQAKAVGQAMPGGGFPPLGELKRVKGELTYLGFALTLKGQVATADVFVPGAAMNVGAKMLAPLFRNVE